MTSKKETVDAALTLLGVDQLVLAIHDQSFPSDDDEESGRGTPYSKGGRAFAQFISDLGFNAFQLGPQGKTSVLNPSPYDSTLFSKNDLSISLATLAHDDHWAKLLDPAELEAVVREAPSREHPRNMGSYTYAWHAQQKALRRAYENFVARTDSLKHLWLAYTLWTRQQSQWLERDSLFEALSAEYGTDDWRQWNEVDKSLFAHGAAATPEQQARVAEIRAAHADVIDFFQFCQFVVHQQHQSFKELAATLKLRLYADLQIGFSQRDIWALRHLLLPNYLLGAPPSRTNPDGQPWGYTVLDPDLYLETDANGELVSGAATKWLISRIDKLLIDFDGIRIDHPHGLVCPWVYESAKEDALYAVQNGSRLFESPAVAGHSQLAQYAIVSQEQLNTHLPRYADSWIAELTDEQVTKYGVLIQAIKDRMVAAGFDPSGLVCEVLSSCPFPLKSVLKLHNLGRFRVTQKARPHNQRDVYRSDNAQPEDWIMVGTHDTKPIWTVVDQWSPDERHAWSEYLANRLEPYSEPLRVRLEAELAASSARLVEAMFADLFIGPARNVSIFFADLLGVKETYNQPGVISDENWILSVPNNYQVLYRERIQRGEALNLPRVLALALHGKCGDQPESRTIIDQLESYSVVAQPL